MMKLFIFAVLMALSAPVIAQESDLTTIPEPTRIEVDQENHRILFFIEGDLQAVLEKGRLSVDGDILSKNFLHGDVDLKKTIGTEGAQ